MALFVPPHSEAELLENVAILAGKTIQQIARLQGIDIPDNQIRQKGWVGKLLERSLGATAKSLPEPDFQHIGVELKTLPLNRNGRPKETTYVCTINLSNPESSWQHSLVKRKLSCILWLPIEADKNIPLAKRRVGSGILWRPDSHQESVLHRDWKELTDMISMGELENITAHQGQYLHIRPKAADTKALCHGINQVGEKIPTLPRGFYLRTSLTCQILNLWP